MRTRRANGGVQVLGLAGIDITCVRCDWLCPGLLALTGAVDNVCFLNLLTARPDIRKLPGLPSTTVRSLPGILTDTASRCGAPFGVFHPCGSWPYLHVQANEDMLRLLA
jgi:hypothetical protein